MKLGEVNQINYTAKELKYKLFKKKTCPTCKGKLKVMHEKESAGESYAPFGTGGGISFTSRELYRLTEFYCCRECGGKFSINELAERAYGV